MSSLSKEQLRARLRLNQRLAVSQSSDNKKPPPYFWRLRPIGSKRNTETTTAWEENENHTTSSSIDTKSDRLSELTFHSTKEKEASSEDLQTKLPSAYRQVEASSKGQCSKLDVADVQEGARSVPQQEETETTLGAELEDNNDLKLNGGILEEKDKSLLEKEVKRLQDVLSQKEEQIKQKDSEIGYLRQVLGEIATAAHVAVQFESSYSFPATYYSAEDVKLSKSFDKVSYPSKRGFHSQPRPESGAFYLSAHTEADIDAHDTRVSYSNEVIKQLESSSNHSGKDRKLKLSLPVDSLGLSGPDTTSGRHKASSLTGDTLSLQSIPSESDSLQYNSQEQQEPSTDMVPPSPRISQLRIQEEHDEHVS
ncbi:uncharacterized protein Gasu_49790 [Galdieria sulphuraria]|uniref:Uncharacterized protein n=1 Tax=Galdieria sulphuraria TaxID=130081 RepID=M2VWB0_GALSU|nr:uncharacterized protein Gasu_49790 [Galdieria sulphuraria]EME27531.1 hypothetical protein Gasu_49790 [Galdieria sulphuraria]|eukprot:XP_005704051.1 hypothetical protein Gasu_49790 [Galdieria sulphuraria]